MNLAQDSYEPTRRFPRAEAFGMIAQIRRAAAAIAANIAEGRDRETAGSFVQFLRQAQGSLQGSLKELETHLLLSARVRLVDEVAVGPLLDRSERLGRMLRGLIRSLQTKTKEA